MYDQENGHSGRNTVSSIHDDEPAAGRLVEVVVHINDDLDEGQREDFEQELRTRRGILDLNFCPNRHHLLTIQYEPSLVSSGNLIEQIRMLVGEAQLIGPI